MMLPLCTNVKLLRLCVNAYFNAERIKRSEPSKETGLMPIDDVSGKRILSVTFISVLKKSISFLHSGVPCSHSIPA